MVTCSCSSSGPCEAVVLQRGEFSGKGSKEIMGFGTVDTVVIVLLVFLLMILLGLQMQITTANKDLARMEDQLKQILDQLTRKG